MKVPKIYVVKQMKGSQECYIGAVFDPNIAKAICDIVNDSKDESMKAYIEESNIAALEAVLLGYLTDAFKELGK